MWSQDKSRQEEPVEDLVARDYQQQMKDICLRKNTIVYLPTGAGKTYIALMVMREMSHQLRSNIDDGGKRTFFLANTVALAKQQAQFFSRFFPFNVRLYTSEVNLDTWKQDRWLSEFREVQILVSTSQILLDILRHGYLSPGNINLLVFDECHRAVGQHPMHAIMKEMMGAPKNCQPRVVGLSGTLLYRELKSKTQVEEELERLENTFNATIATVGDYDEYTSMCSFSTNAKEVICVYRNSFLESVPVIRMVIGMVMKFSEQVEKIHLPKYNTTSTTTLRVSKPKPTKEVKRALNEFQLQLLELGIFGGSVALLGVIVEMELNKRKSECSKARALYRSMISFCEEVYCVLQSVMKDMPIRVQVKKFSSDRVRKMILYLEQEYNGTTADTEKQALVFVQRRFSAKVLYHVLRLYFGHDEKNVPEDDAIIRPEFIVGINRPMEESIEHIIIAKHDRQVIKKFRKHQINVLCATNVLEEGIDLQMCNIVIMFDEPLSYSSYMQSKGRARMKSSTYLLMVKDEDRGKFTTRIQLYHDIEDTLKKALIGKTINRPEPLEHDVRKELLDDITTPFITPAGAKLDLLSSVQLLNRYCMSMPRDLFTGTNVAWERVDQHGKICVSVKLPLQSTIREIVHGEPMKNLKLAKQSAAFNVCKRLYDVGELSMHLLPVTVKDKVQQVDDLYFSHWRTVGVETKPKQAGQANNVRCYRVHYPAESQHCTPQSEADECFIYILRTKALFERGTQGGNIASFADLYSSSNNFGIMTRKPLPPLAPMQLFCSLGKIGVEVVREPLRITLDPATGREQLAKLKRFHLLLFRDLLRLWKQFIALDVEAAENGFLIVPMADSKTIDWKLVVTFPYLQQSEEPTTLTRQRMVFNAEHYRNRVVHPWYKSDPMQNYVVVKVHEELSPQSPFPNSVFNTFEQYFSTQHQQVIVRPEDQFLIEVKGISTNLNLLHPGTEQDGGNARSRRRDFQELLIPELVHNFEFPADYWLKATLLPSVLHRVHYLLIAEQIRLDLANSVQIGTKRCDRIEPLTIDREVTLVTQKAASYKVSDFGDSFEEDDQEHDDMDDGDGDGSDNEDEMRVEKLREMLLKINMDTAVDTIVYPWKEEELPVDIERHWESTSRVDLDYYCSFVEKYQTNAAKLKTETVHSFTKRSAPDLELELGGLTLDDSASSSSFDEAPVGKPAAPLAIEDGLGPPGEIQILKLTPFNTANLCLQQGDILQALTSKHAHDVFNLERFELLGDAFLKFSVSAFLLMQHTSWHEGYLTTCKSRMVSNRNLLYCAMQYGLPGMQKVHRFDPRNEWLPPLATVPKVIREAMIKAKEMPALLYKLELSEEEVQTGIVQQSKVDAFLPLIHENEEESRSTLMAVLQHVQVSDKTVADSMEALLGVCVKSVGYERSFRALSHFGILPRGADLAKLLCAPNYTVLSYQTERDTIDRLLIAPEKIERTLGYQFRNRTLLLQAFTHATYTANTLTRSYEQLEFLGDAVLDFLITLYIYERNPNMSPGQLTDLRSALVNNVTLACVLVRFRLHHYILSMSPMLTDKIDKFVEVQSQKRNRIGDWVRLLTEESETPLAEYVDVPKVLGDVFEAVIGAIYLDSGCDLVATWGICYSLLQREIENFSLDTPIQVVRQLYEHQDARPHFSEPRVEDDVVIVRLHFTLRNQRLKVFGCGQNKEDARRAAAKLALTKLRG
ncbi:endoribonuclease Dicer [Anopheles aquasalis]|uniref:endoribonuclease Dicer n=1 Tax=Anopheles aquasalis TaxID=42839 RepID=UPI00215A4007|nr:endoribonuclease Dicer [Anopheles aquasalis]